MAFAKRSMSVWVQGGGNVPIVVEIDEGEDNSNREEVWRVPSR